MTDAPKHPINPDPANELASDHSPIDPRDFRNALGTYATGVTIITAAAADGKPRGITCNSFASVSLNPPLVLWSLVIFSTSMSVFQNASHFAVNVLGASQQALANTSARFASIQSLIGAISAAGDQKAILDLQARISAELGMLQNEQTKLQILHQATEAQAALDRQRDWEQSVAGQGRFEARFQPRP